MSEVDLDDVFGNIDDMVAGMLDSSVSTPIEPTPPARVAAAPVFAPGVHVEPKAPPPKPTTARAEEMDPNTLADIMASVSKISDAKHKEEERQKQEERKAEEARKHSAALAEMAKQAHNEVQQAERASTLAAASGVVEKMTQSIAGAVGRLVEDLKLKQGMYVERTKEIVTACAPILAESKTRSQLVVDELSHKNIASSSQMLYDRLNLLVKAAKDCRADETVVALQTLAASGFQVLIAVKELHASIIQQISAELDTINKK
ncbi:hypothetical protein CAOG_05962 [Capsaspora owczarzaki ATCC 30864]|uniref:Uncharacterized protein n=1 Tax=Capsaspora owczarzaki (strain ATCC 30864) TaxID=595528 RepID=A0A0D2WUD1_CAPO3|nr:hypothetical protein CAOG_05962 [Capsaspora owczarzaki ATCC 30864]KJE95513.1 hypothetical protein CAOG_005962 [Capsaspora owczarzaki ATCC 30864]|eukprot:XP_004345552.1 hypothetical protein CAOG_05962 [Capsaspora owczarzaki ATCC 30864]